MRSMMRIELLAIAAASWPRSNADMSILALANFRGA